MLKALLIDDEPFILQGLQVLLNWEEEGFSICKTAKNGKEAYDYLLNNSVDFIISDIKMPEMTGLELLSSIRENNVSDAYFVFLTGFADFNYVKTAMQYNCVNYLLKPVDVNELQNILRNVKKKCDSRKTSTVPFFNESKWKDDSNNAPIKDKNIICKKELDALISSINTDDHLKIKKSVADLYTRFNEINLSSMSITLNINYLVFNLIQLASEQNAEIDQEEALNFIIDSSLEKGINNASQEHIYRFACEYASYLMQLHRTVPSNILHQIAKDIDENYNSNLTLKNLSEKYCLNGAYLGQLFKKQYKVYFKDYLNSVRIDKAVELLTKSDMKIYNIAEEVGYKDIDYFINLFIKAKGCTPARYRKQKLEEDINQNANVANL